MAAWEGPTGETAVLLDANNQPWTKPSISAGSANFFIEANTGAATGSFYGFQSAPSGGQRTRTVLWHW